ncbi:MAG: hypothetical protein R3C68_14130 [Myxococcota bacterium]
MLRVFALASSLFALMCISASSSQARTVEAGSVWTGVGLGPGFALPAGAPIDGRSSDNFLILLGQIEYAFSKSWQVVGSMDFGFAGSGLLRFHAGGKYRIGNLKMPISPYFQLQLTGGGLFDVRDEDYFLLGARLTSGIDYFALANLAVGLSAAADLNTTLGGAHIFFGTFDVLAMVSFGF